MKTRSVLISTAARLDVEGICDYLASEAGAFQVERFETALAETARALGEYPYRGRLLDMKRRPPFPVRTVLVRRFPKIRLFYTVSESWVSVARVMHGSRRVKSSDFQP